MLRNWFKKNSAPSPSGQESELCGIMPALSDGLALPGLCPPIDAAEPQPLRGSFDAIIKAARSIS